MRVFLPTMHCGEGWEEKPLKNVLDAAANVTDFQPLSTGLTAVLCEATRRPCPTAGCGAVFRGGPCTVVGAVGSAPRILGGNHFYLIEWPADRLQSFRLGYGQVFSSQLSLSYHRNDSWR